MPVRITDVRDVTKPIASAIRNAYIDFSKMTTMACSRSAVCSSMRRAATTIPARVTTRSAPKCAATSSAATPS